MVVFIITNVWPRALFSRSLPLLNKAFWELPYLCQCPSHTPGLTCLSSRLTNVYCLEFLSRFCQFSIFLEFSRQPRVRTTLPSLLSPFISIKTLSPQGIPLFLLNGPLDNLVWAYNSSTILPDSKASPSLKFQPGTPSLGGDHNENHPTTQNLLTAPSLSMMASIVLVRMPRLPLIQLLSKTSHAVHTKKQTTQPHRFCLYVLSPSLLLSQAQPWQLQQPPNVFLPSYSVNCHFHARYTERLWSQCFCF